MDNKLTKEVLALRISLCSSAAFAEVERVTHLTVENPGPLIASFDHFTEMNDSKNKPNRGVLLTHVHDRTSPSTHTFVAFYDDVEHFERVMVDQATSKHWAEFIKSED